MKLKNKMLSVFLVAGVLMVFGVRLFIARQPVSKNSYDLIELGMKETEISKIIRVGPGDYSDGTISAVKPIDCVGNYPFPDLVDSIGSEFTEQIFDSENGRYLGTIKSWQSNEVLIRLLFRGDGVLSQKKIMLCWPQNQGIFAQLRDFLTRKLPF